MVKKNIYFPVRTDTIKSLGKITSFEGEGGENWYGRKFTMENGDVFSHWSNSQEILEQFEKGTHIIYQMIKEPKGDGTFKSKVKYIEIVGNLAAQFAPYVIEEMARSIHNSVRLACSLAESGVIKTEKISDMAQSIHNTTKKMLLTENFILNDVEDEQNS